MNNEPFIKMFGVLKELGFLKKKDKKSKVSPKKKKQDKTDVDCCNFC